MPLKNIAFFIASDDIMWWPTPIHISVNNGSVRYVDSAKYVNPLLPNVAYRRHPLNVPRSRTSPIGVANSVSNLEAFFSPLSQVLRKIYTG
jgi:hypothetical protein